MIQTALAEALDTMTIALTNLKRSTLRPYTIGTLKDHLEPPMAVPDRLSMAINHVSQ